MNPNTPPRVSVIVAAATAILSGLVLTACAAPRAAAAASATSDAVAVAVAPVALADVTTPIDAGGVVQARTTTTLTARLLAPVREVRVAPGDRVRRGQTLIVLDGDDLAAAARAARSAATAAEQGATAAAADLRAAEAALTLARASHDRIAGLSARHSATAQELDDAVAALRSADARVGGAAARALQATSSVESARAASDHARTTESFTTLVAPFDGLITQKMIEPGNMASPGTPLLRVEDTGRFRLEVRVDESRAAGIQNGDGVPVILGTGASEIAGTVEEVSRSVDADTRAFLVKIALPEIPGLRSGQFGRARFRSTPHRALIVPPAAIVRRGQLTSVFVVENARARVRLVNVRDSEVVAGLTDADVVILSPPPGLIDGSRVDVGGR